MANKEDFKTIKIHGKEYVEVKERLLFLAANYEGKYSIETSYEYYPDRLMWVVKATLTINDKIYNGLAQELETDKSSMVNKTSALENAETSAVGRACAMAGIGIVDSIASVDEITKAKNREASMSSTPSYSQSTQPQSDSPDLGECNKCGANMVKSPKTGKIFCEKKCWLNK